MLHGFMAKKDIQKKVLSCKNDVVITKIDLMVDGVKIKKGTKGRIMNQRITPQGYGRATVSFDKYPGSVEIATSRLKCG